MGQFLILIIFTLLAFSIITICTGGAGLILMPVIGLFLPISYVPAKNLNTAKILNLNK